MTRIIGGRAGGRRLTTPRGQATRPTSDRVREALFSAVESWCSTLEGLRVLDLYAGSGAVGLEAWSRGAGVVTLVEQDRRTAALIRTNAAELGFARADVRAQSVSAVLAGSPQAPYDVVFLDPPYPLENAAVEADLAALVANGWLVPDALVVVERGSRSRGLVWPEGLELHREKKYGETVLWYGHATAEEDEPGPGDPAAQEQEPDGEQ